MDFLERRAEEKIREAMERGEFDNLPGAGKPLRFDSNGHVPDELRLAYKLLKDGGFLPPELELKKEVVTLKELLRTVVDDDRRDALARKINDRVLRLNVMLKRSFAHEEHQVSIRYSVFGIRHPAQPTKCRSQPHNRHSR